MVRSCGADASVVAFWVGWIKSLASILVVSLGGIVSSTGALSWSYGFWWFKEVRNGVRGLVCVIPGCAGLFSSDAWSRGSVGILATSLGFAKCFCKSPSISQVNFAICRPFLSLEVISQPFWSLEIISHPFRSSKVISQPKIDFATHFVAQKWFRSREILAQLCALVFKRP